MKQLSKTDRKEIAYFLGKGRSIRAIAQMLERAPSTISREISRNTVKGKYIPDKAHLKSYQTRYWVRKETPRLWETSWKPFRCFLEEKLKLEHPWSLAEICGHWSTLHPEQSISQSTLYRYIHRWEFGLKKYLPHQRYRYRCKKRGSPSRQLIPNRTWIDDRPESINQRLDLGDWEGDTLGSKRGETETILGSIERKSRFLIAKKVPNRKPAQIASHIQKWQKQYSMNSITLDSGIEFRNHQDFGCNTFFCHPYSSWEKGQVEYAMRMLRRLVPKKTSLKNITQKQLQAFVDDLNHRPRKCLNWQTPHQVFYQSSQLNL